MGRGAPAAAGAAQACVRAKVEGYVCVSLCVCVYTGLGVLAHTHA